MEPKKESTPAVEAESTEKKEVAKTTMPAENKTTPANDVASQLRRTKRMMIAAIIVVIVLVILGLCAGAYWSVYSSGTDSAFRTNVVKTLPLPVGSVNGKMLSLRTFEKRVKATEHFYSKQEELQLGLSENPGSEAIRQQEFDRLVDGALLNEIAKERKVAVTSDEINKYFDDNILPQAQGGMDEVTSTLNDLYGWSVDDFKAEVLSETVLRQKIQEQLSADTELNAEAKTTIDRIYADVTTGGKSFEEQAKEFSEDEMSAQDNGKLGAINKGQTVKEFEDKAFSAEIGKVTEPFQTQYGWHILVVHSRDDAAGTADVSHILISSKQVQDLIDERRATAKVRAYISGLTTEVEEAQ